MGIGTDRGAYDVTVRACARGEFCGPWSSPPTRFTTTSMVCKPEWFQAVPGDGKATLWWNPDPDATGYTVDSVQDSVSGEEHVIDGLTNGTSYSYSVQVLGPGGPSDWRGDSVMPQVSQNRPPKPTKLIVEENNSRRFPGVALKWEAPLVPTFTRSGFRAVALFLRAVTLLLGASAVPTHRVGFPVLGQVFWQVMVVRWIKQTGQRMSVRPSLLA